MFAGRSWSAALIVRNSNIPPARPVDSSQCPFEVLRKAISYMSSSNLLDRFLTGQPLSWRYTRRIFLITLAFHVSPWLLMAIGDAILHPYALGKFHLSELPYLIGAFTFLVLVLPYWSIFFLALLSDPANPMHRWRVWGAWLLMSYPFAGVYLMLLFGDRFNAAKAGPLLPIQLIPFSPVIAIVGAVAGQLLWYLFRLLRTGFEKFRPRHNDHTQSSST